MKKLLSILLAVLMVATLGVVNVAAEENDENTQITPQNDGGVNLTDSEWLQSKVDEGGEIVLEKDLVLNSTILVKNDVVLNLNGYTISNSSVIWNEVTGDWSLISVREGGKLTINGEGKLQAKENDCYAIDALGGTIVLNGGEYIGNICSVYVNKGQLIIYDGKFSIQQLDSNKPYGFVLNCLDENNKNGTATISVFGGEFQKFNPSESVSENPTKNFVADGYVAIKVGENFKVVGKESISVAKIGDECYLTLQEAVDVGGEIKLLNNVNENITVSSGKEIVLDLNGFTIDGGTGNSTATILNNGNITILDSSENKTGTVKRSDYRGESTSYYVIENDGIMVINGGNYLNKPGMEDKWSGASLICNGPTKAATLTINDGYFEVENFITVKNDEYGTLNVNGGTINAVASENSVNRVQSIQNWNVATVKNAELNGDVYCWVYKDNEHDNKLILDNVQLNGAIVATRYDETDYKPLIDILSGNYEITGRLVDDPSFVSISSGTFNRDPLTIDMSIVTGKKAYLNTDGKYEVLVKPTEISATNVSIPQNDDNFNELATESVKYVWGNGGEHEYVEDFKYTVTPGGSVEVIDNKLSAKGTGKSVVTVTGEGLTKTFEVTVTSGVPEASFDENGLTVVFPTDTQKYIDSMLKGVSYDDKVTDSGFYNQIYLTYQGEYNLYGGFNNGAYKNNGEVTYAVNVIKANADNTGVIISKEDLIKYGVVNGEYKVQVKQILNNAGLKIIDLGILEIETGKEIDKTNDRVNTLNIEIDKSALEAKVGDAVADLNKVAKITDENGNPVKNVSVSWVKVSEEKSPNGQVLYCDAKYSYKYKEDGTVDIVETPYFDADTLYYLYVEYMPNGRNNYEANFKIKLNGEEIEVNKKNVFRGAGGIIDFRLHESLDYLTIVPIGYATAKVDKPAGVTDEVINNKLDSMFTQSQDTTVNGAAKQLEYVSESNSSASNASLKAVVGDGGKLTVALRFASFEETKQDNGNTTVTMSKMAFDVAPVSADGAILHGKLSKAITFRLPVDSASTSKYANVYHEGTFLAQYEIKTDADGKKYIEVTNDEFSVYSYELTNTVYSTGSDSSSDSSSGSSGSGSSSSSSQSTYKKPVVNTSVR